MRHNNAGKKLGRDTGHRKALFRNMAKALVTYERIRTTETKAKVIRKVVDKLITLALKNDLAARREAYKVLGNHGLVKKLFDEIGPRYAGVPGGFTRVLKLGLPRAGDNAPMAILELTKRVEKAEPEKPAEAEAKPVEVAEAPKKAPRKKKAEEPAAEGEEKPKRAPRKKKAEAEGEGQEG